MHARSYHKFSGIAQDVKQSLYSSFCLSKRSWWNMVLHSPLHLIANSICPPKLKGVPLEPVVEV